MVYQATQVYLKRSVAIKILPLNRTNPPAIRRFQREWRALGNLDHPQVIKAFDAGETDGFHYLATEFVDGINLSRCVQETGPLRAADACEIVHQAARGLSYIHANGLVHRDIKPSNLILSRSGQIKILDLGLALLKAGSEDSHDLTGLHCIFWARRITSPRNRLAIVTTLTYGPTCTVWAALSITYCAEDLPSPAPTSTRRT